MKEAQGQQIEYIDVAAYFTVSRSRLITFHIITLGFYDVYWFYKNFKAISVVSNEVAHPILLAIFAPLTSGKLFKHFHNELEEQEIDYDFSVNSWAVGYFLLQLFTFGLLSFLIIAKAQWAMETFKTTIFDDPHRTSNFSWGEIIMVIVGVLLAIGNVLG